MASALAGGMMARGFKASQLVLADANPEQLVPFRSRGVFTTTDNAEVVRRADVLVLAVKPQVMREVLLPLAAAVQKKRPLLVSIAAGVTAGSICQWLGAELPVVRAMPNTPALVQAGAAGLFANAAVSAEQRALAESVLAAVGIALWVGDESLIDAVTAVSGSGPAYFFYLMEAIMAAGQRLGLDERTVRALTLQTALGAAQMAITADVDPAELRRRVTSPGGTTERAIGVLEQAGLRTIVDEALAACAARSVELARMLGSAG